MINVLVAEDDPTLAMIAAQILIDYGYHVCGIARTVDEAIDLGQRHRPDLAVLDNQLANGGRGTGIAARLSAEVRIGILYLTGDVEEVMLTATSGDACLAKPYKVADLSRALEVVAQIVTTGVASPPFPVGLKIFPCQSRLIRL